MGKVFAAGLLAGTEATVRNLTESAVVSSRIEGEHPNPGKIGASIRRRIAAGSGHAVQRQHGEPGIALVTADASANRGEPLTTERLHGWHRQLFSGPNSVNFAASRRRDDRMGPMRVVSGGPIGRTPVIHFEAPSAKRVEDEIDRFLEWFNQPEDDPDLTRKAAVVHLWFVTVHPYDDGNGRIARAITDLTLARCDGTPVRCYSMSDEILRQRDDDYQVLQVTRSASMDITAWMAWFLDCLTSAVDHGDRTADVARLGILASNRAGGRSISYRVEAPLSWYDA